MNFPRLARLALFGLGLLTYVGTSTQAFAAPLKVRVRGAARLSARAARDQTNAAASELVLSGSLTDDVGTPLPMRRVSVRVVREGAPDDDRVAEALQHPRGCDNAGRGPTAWAVVASGRNEILATTDEDGRFCVRASLDPPDRYRATLVYVPAPNDALVDGASRELTFDLSRRALALRFDPTPRVVAADAPRTSIEALAIVDDDATPRVAPGLKLVLASEKDEIATGTTDNSGRVRFDVVGAKLGPPGRGELRVSFAGDAATAESSHVEEIERHVKVVLKVPAAERGQLVAGSPEDGIPLTTEVSSSAGAVSEGSVEARVGEIVVGTAPVERGVARLTLTFAGEGSEALVRLRYVPASPWYEPPATDPSIRVPLREPSLLAKAPLFLTGLAVLVLFLLGRVSGQKNKTAAAAPVPAPDRAGAPGLEVVRAAADGDAHWTGTVIDAHEGTPIAGARVWIERGTFEGREELASAVTGGDGRFTLKRDFAKTGGEIIVAEARLHARFSQDLPSPGEIAIALAERRRAILARLVEWARRRGAPFDARPEATPGHVRRAASGETATVRWAEAVERAAFGPGEVDAGTEEAIEQLGPPDPAKRG